ncbi:MAG: T9SS type A sorting domain-containing protein [Sphingobacteriales bacterium JAD_PAG50586_3]|nr:MAG: T9SS type A sorting domain-containing protein [Sphingobacteriales bacterium JAD_PAG50586_3]
MQLNYDFQYMPYDPTDSVNVSVLLSNWNSSDSKRDTIAYGANYYNGMAHQWISGSTYLNYFSNAIPDSAIIVISSSSKVPKEGSYIYIDNLQFDGVANDIGEQKPPNYIIYPNPTSDILNIDIAEHLLFTTTILNSFGQPIYSHQAIGNFQIGTTTFPAGIYFLQVKSQNRFTTEKFIKQ